MRIGQGEFGLLRRTRRQRCAIEPGLEHRGEVLVAHRPERDGAGGGGLQPCVAVLAGQAHQPQAGAVALFGMRHAFELEGDHTLGVRSHRGAPGDELAGRPLAVGLVRGGHVLGERAEGAAPVAAGMHRHAASAGEALDARERDAKLQHLPDQRVGHAVVVAVELDVIVDVGLGLLPLGELERRGGQRTQRRLVERLEGAATIARQALEGACVEILEQLGDGHVELGQREEAPVPQPRQDPALHDLHAHLHLALVLRLVGACGQDRHAVVLGELGSGALQLRRVSVRFADHGAGVVGDDQLGHAADETQRPPQRPQPVGLRLRGRGAGEGVVRGPEHGHEDLRPRNLAGLGVDDRHRVARVVDEELLAGAVHLAHRALEALGEVPVEVAEARILVGRPGRRLDVLLPQQCEGDVLALEPLMDAGEIGHPVAHRRPARTRRPAQQRAQARLIGRRQLGPAHAAGLGGLHVLGDDALGDRQRARDALMRERAVVLEP